MFQIESTSEAVPYMPPAHDLVNSDKNLNEFQISAFHCQIKNRSQTPTLFQIP